MSSRELLRLGASRKTDMDHVLSTSGIQVVNKTARSYSGPMDGSARNYARLLNMSIASVRRSPAPSCGFSLSFFTCKATLVVFLIF